MTTITLPQSTPNFTSWKRLFVDAYYYMVEPASASAAFTIKSLQRIKTENENTLCSALSPAEKWERELQEITQECSVPNWDGYDAKPLDEVSIQCVRAFRQKLPSYITLPNLIPEPNGDLTMEWYKNGYHLIIGIDKQRQIAWACRSNNARYGGGDSPFTHCIPDNLLSLLHQIEKIPYVA